MPAWLQPPDWLVREVQQRVVLVLNHVLQQENEAMARLSRQKGQVVQVSIAQIAIKNIANDSPKTSPFSYAASAEHVEGINAFLEKRPAKF